MKRIAVFILAATLLAGCYNDDKETLYPTAVCNTTSVTYNLVVKPIMVKSCAYSGCHSGAAPASGLDLSTHTSVQAIALNGKLSGVINHTTGFSPMPKGAAKLSKCEIDQITKWTTDGALNN